MFNNGRIKVEKAIASNSILADVTLHSAFGCTVAKAVAVNGVVKKGTPIAVDLTDRNTPATAGSGTTANAIVLHDVIVSGESANATALIIGVVNMNRLEADVQALLTTEVKERLAERCIRFIKD